MPGFESDQQGGRRHPGRLAFARGFYKQQTLFHTQLERRRRFSIIAATRDWAGHFGRSGKRFPCFNTDMKLSAFLSVVLTACTALSAEHSPALPAAKPADDYSGMYSFLREGEFVQLTVEEDGRVAGFVSRFGDSDSDRGAFLDHFFKQAKLDGNQLTFTTDTVHGVWYEFNGTIERGEGKSASEEAYYVLKGKLTEDRSDADKKVTSTPRQVMFKSFPKNPNGAEFQRK